MTAKPYADIRAALVDGIRNDPGRPAKVKHAAEVLIGCIDANSTQEAFLQAYRVFKRAADGTPLPPELSPGEVAQRLGLLDDPS
jgi:hypothetical protein